MTGPDGRAAARVKAPLGGEAALGAPTARGARAAAPLEAGRRRAAPGAGARRAVSPPAPDALAGSARTRAGLATALAVLLPAALAGCGADAPPVPPGPPAATAPAAPDARVTVSGRAAIGVAGRL